MPRFFLNLRHGSNQLTADPEGDEIAEEALVRAHALRVARAMMRSRSQAVRDWLGCSLEITDQNNRLVLILPFSETVREPDCNDGIGAC